MLMMVRMVRWRKGFTSRASLRIVKLVHATSGEQIRLFWLAARPAACVAASLAAGG